MINRYCGGLPTRERAVVESAAPAEPIPEEEHEDLVGAYYRRLTSMDRQERIAAARAWSMWEGGTSRLVPDPELVARTGDATFAEAFARIECHYFVNRGFFTDDNQLLDNIGRIAHIPSVIVQGRYDVVCPPESAYQGRLRNSSPSNPTIARALWAFFIIEPPLLLNFNP